MANNYTSPAEWSRMARAVAEATDLGIRAARAHDLENFADAVEQLENHTEATRDLHAHMVRELLETQYQDGVSGDDVSEVLTRTVGGAGLWNVPVDPSAVAMVLTVALGVGESSDTSDAPATTIPPAEIIGAAILVVADLAASAAIHHEPSLVRAMEEIRRAQTVEMP
ncbi:hypothetical protein [Gordonia sp. SL306]|uniref:hypothetical protein n=1 Tax=Gordonia sp. SL306 TaxID=2995145 RepID=UPI00226FBD90|nr:hypothetical protein [Gordonia sp. SL306]WAC55544.1 hypothetical protein OVA31_23665 [Gordonia sp. SL306]